MKLNIILYCVILLNTFCDFISYLKGIPCHYSWLIGADVLNVFFCICFIILGNKVKDLRKELKEQVFKNFEGNWSRYSVINHAPECIVAQDVITCVKVKRLGGE